MEHPNNSIIQEALEELAEMKFKRILVVYHSHCNDGLVSAAVVDHWGKERGRAVIEYLPRTYGDELNQGNDFELVEDRYDACFIVDFSFDGAVLETLCCYIPMVFVFDHHASAVEKLCEHFEINHYPENLYMDLCTDKGISGANLTWKHLFKDRPVPELVADVADRDTWLFERPNSKYTDIGLKLLGNGISPIYIAHSFLRNDNMHELVAQGRSGKRMWDMTLASLIPQGYWSTLTLETGTVNLWVTNCPYSFTSDLADLIKHRPTFDKQKDACCMFIIKAGSVKLSFRSSNGKAKPLAELFGGGGHPDSAGAQDLSLDQCKFLF